MSVTRPIRVLVVDDSAFARKVMRQVLEGEPRCEVVGIARDGLDALEKITELAPDVITLDLVMPELDGLGVLEALKALPSPPRVVVVSMSDADSELGVSALLAGAFDVVHKPTALATDRLYELADELRRKVLLAADSPPGIANPEVVRAPSVAPGPILSTARELVVVGASTGGPRAVTQLLRGLPATFPLPIAVVVHMPAGYTEAFANRLNSECAVSVSEASAGATFEPGHVLVARAGVHLKVKRVAGSLVAALEAQPIEHLHRPSVDALFTSAAEAAGGNVIGVVMTGMGSDGLEGARALRTAGSIVLVEHESTCVVYGMPRAIADAGLATERVPLPGLAAAVIARL